METAEIIFERILRRYNKKPDGWNFSIGRGHDDTFFDVLVSHDRDVWEIKLDTLYRPNPTGVGVKIGKTEKIKENPYFFGFRPLPEGIMPALSENGFSKDVVSEILRESPKAISQIRTPGIVQGPITFSKSPLDFISERHKRLDDRLRVELNRILSKSGDLSAYG